MKYNGSSERHQNNNLIVMIESSNFLIPIAVFMISIRKTNPIIFRNKDKRFNKRPRKEMDYKLESLSTISIKILEYQKLQKEASNLNSLVPLTILAHSIN